MCWVHSFSVTPYAFFTALGETVGSTWTVISQCSALKRPSWTRFSFPALSWTVISLSGEDAWFLCGEIEWKNRFIRACCCGLMQVQNISETTLGRGLFRADSWKWRIRINQFRVNEDSGRRRSFQTPFLIRWVTCAMIDPVLSDLEDQWLSVLSLTRPVVYTPLNQDRRLMMSTAYLMNLIHAEKSLHLGLSG